MLRRLVSAPATRVSAHRLSHGSLKAAKRNIIATKAIGGETWTQENSKDATKSNLTNSINALRVLKAERLEQQKAEEKPKPPTGLDSWRFQFTDHFFHRAVVRFDKWKVFNTDKYLSVKNTVRPQVPEKLHKLVDHPYSVFFMSPDKKGMSLGLQIYHEAIHARYFLEAVKRSSKDPSATIQDTGYLQGIQIIDILEKFSGMLNRAAPCLIIDDTTKGFHWEPKNERPLHSMIKIMYLTERILRNYSTGKATMKEFKDNMDKMPLWILSTGSDPAKVNEMVPKAFENSESDKEQTCLYGYTTPHLAQMMLAWLQQDTNVQYWAKGMTVSKTLQTCTEVKPNGAQLVINYLPEKFLEEVNVKELESDYTYWTLETPEVKELLTVETTDTQVEEAE